MSHQTESITRIDTNLDKFGSSLILRPLTMGEIGCFLSHYLIWEEVRTL